MYKNISKLAIGLLMMTTIFSPISAKAISTKRISGEDRYNTSIMVSKTAFEDNSAETVVLASGENFPDALVGGVLAGANKAPLLLTRKDQLSPELVEEMKRLGSKKAYILGGESSISKSLEEELKKNLEVVRVAGKNRYETANAVTIEMNCTCGLKTSYVVDGKNFPDALAAVPFVVSKEGILALDEGFPVHNGFAIGGEKSVPGYKERISGENRYETAVEIAKKTENKVAILVDGSNYPDALSASSLANQLKADILLTPSQKLPSIVENELKNYEEVYIIGGENSVSIDVEDELGRINVN